MFISIIVPVYNRKALIAQCLLSLVQQTINNYEIIVIDDGSTDGTSSILKEFTPHDRLRIFYLSQNHGPAFARNFALTKSNGDIAAFIDSDCQASANWLAELTRPFLSDRSILITTGKVSNPTASNYWEAVNKEPYFTQNTSGMIDRAIGCNMAVRRSFLDEHPFDEKLPAPAAEDTDLCLFCTERGHKIFYNHLAEVIHHPRKTLKNTLEQNFYYGFYTSYVRIKHQKHPLYGIQLPLAVLLSCILGLALQNPVLIKIAIFLICIYLGVVFWVSAPRNAWIPSLIYYPGYLLRSMSYSAGIIYYLINLPFKRDRI